MAASTGASVGAALLAAGMATTTPVAIVVDASGPHQAVWRSNLGALAAGHGPLPAPCVLVVGAVAACSP